MKRWQMGIVPATRGKVVGRMSFSFMTLPSPATATATATASGLTATGVASALVSVPAVNDCTLWADQGGFPISSLWASTPFDQICTTLHCPDASANSGGGVTACAPQVKFLLIVEKEGPFNRLCEDRFFDRMPCIIVTGCGFPDVATRCLVGKLKSAHPELQVIGVCDYNPYGVALLLTYISCSACPTAHELREPSSSNSSLLCNEIKWLGMRSAAINTLETRLQKVSKSSTMHLQPYTTHDFTKIKALLRCDALKKMNPQARQVYTFRCFAPTARSSSWTCTAC